MSIDIKRMSGFFLDLVKTDSPSLKERQAADYVISVCRGLGMEVFEDDAGKRLGGSAGNIIARKRGISGVPTLMFAAHLDNVPPCTGIRPQITGDVVTSDRTTVLGADDKAGVAVILEMLSTISFDECRHGDLEAVFTVAEEIGLLGAKHLELSQINARTAFVLDSSGPPGTYVISAPWQNSISVEVKGRAAHAGVEPEKGISAIRIAAEAVASMPFGRIDPETTANIGQIYGGLASNIVTEKVNLKGEARSRNPEKLSAVTAEIEDSFRNASGRHGGECRIEISRAYDGFKLEQDSFAVSLYLEAAGKCGILPEAIGTGGGSDTNVFSKAGITALNMGLGMQNVHSVNECISLKDMAITAELITSIVISVCERSGL